VGLGRDIWRIGLVEAPIEAVIAAGRLDAFSVRWLPMGPPFTFLADPFGVWRDGVLHLFAESYDYATRHGVIELLTFDADLWMLDRRTVLREPWHLSYPFVWEADGETWMLPEAYRSGGLTLYRAAAFPDRWEPAARLELDAPAIDATPFRHGGRWWLAYAPSSPRAARQRHLHLAFADTLTGPWTPHPCNPVRIDASSSRLGGVPVPRDGDLLLPVQDCTRTYGGAVRLLRVVELTPERFHAQAGPPILPPDSAAPYVDGLHTLSACGPITLIDVKRIDRSLGGLGIGAGRLLSRLRR
jgi:hypothetical protein